MKLITAISKVKFINDNLGVLYPSYVYEGGYKQKDLPEMQEYIYNYYEEAKDIKKYFKAKEESAAIACKCLTALDDDYEKLQNIFK